MPDIVITEFMDEAAITEGLRGHDVVYDPKLVDKPAELASLLGDTRALIVRNRTQVRAPLLASAPRLKVVGRQDFGPCRFRRDRARDSGPRPRHGHARHRL